MTEFIAASVPAQTLQVSDDTLFRLAMVETGDPLQWVSIANLNGLTDPWLSELTEVLIPPVFPSGTQTGILGL